MEGPQGSAKLHEGRTVNTNRVRSALPRERFTAKVPRAESGAEGRAENPLPDSQKKRHRVEDHVTEPATKPDRTELLRVWHEKWEAIEDCRVREEQLAYAGLLVQPLIAARVRLSYECLAIIRELKGIALQRLLKQTTDVGQSDAQVQRDEDDAKGGPEHWVLDVSNRVPAVKFITTDPSSMLWGLLLHSWAALERCRWGEELLHAKGLPTHCLVAARARLVKVMCALLTEDRRNDAQALFIKYVVRTEASPAEPLPDAAKQALKELLQQFPSKDRRMLRQLLHRARPSETSSSAEGS